MQAFKETSLCCLSEQCVSEAKSPTQILSEPWLARLLAHLFHAGRGKTNVAVINFCSQCRFIEEAVSIVTCPVATLGFEDIQPIWKLSFKSWG